MDEESIEMFNIIKKTELIVLVVEFGHRQGVYKDKYKMKIIDKLKFIWKILLKAENIENNQRILDCQEKLFEKEEKLRDKQKIIDDLKTKNQELENENKELKNGQNNQIKDSQRRNFEETKRNLREDSNK